MSTALFENKKARFEYQVESTVEAGVALVGGEVKSLRLGRGSINEAFVRIIEGEGQLINMQIHPYGFSDNRDYDPKRTRKLLLHKKELYSLEQKVKSGNYVLIPLKMYQNKQGKYKLLVGLAKGRKTHEKRALLKARDLQREVKREFKENIK